MPSKQDKRIENTEARNIFNALDDIVNIFEVVNEILELLKDLKGKIDKIYKQIDS